MTNDELNSPLIRPKRIEGAKGVTDPELNNHDWIIVVNLPAIQLADGYLLIKKIHPAGKKPMAGEEFVRGYLQK